jgi:hypothetical protein
MEQALGNPPQKKWKNIIFVDESHINHPQSDQTYEEIDAKEAIAALTTALAEALREANQIPSKRTRLR